MEAGAVDPLAFVVGVVVVVDLDPGLEVLGAGGGGLGGVPAVEAVVADGDAAADRVVTDAGDLVAEGVDVVGGGDDGTAARVGGVPGGDEPVLEVVGEVPGLVALRRTGPLGWFRKSRRVLVEMEGLKRKEAYGADHVRQRRGPPKEASSEVLCYVVVGNGLGKVEWRLATFVAVTVARSCSS